MLRVDKEKGYIDLLKRRVSQEDIVKCDERYNKLKAVHLILRHCAEKFGLPLEELYQTIGWPLNRKYGHAYDAFKLLITEPLVFDDIKPPSEDVLNELKLYILRRLTPQAIKVRADVEVLCFSYEGIDAIKRALKAAEAVSTETMQVKAKLSAAPLYVISVQALDKNAAGGEVKVIMEPKAVTANEDAQLQALLEQKAEDDKSDDESDDE